MFIVLWDFYYITLLILLLILRQSWPLGAFYWLLGHLTYFRNCVWVFSFSFCFKPFLLFSCDILQAYLVYSLPCGKVIFKTSIWALGVLIATEVFDSMYS